MLWWMDCSVIIIFLVIDIKIVYHQNWCLTEKLIEHMDLVGETKLVRFNNMNIIDRLLKNCIYFTNYQTKVR